MNRLLLHWVAALFARIGAADLLSITGLDFYKKMRHAAATQFISDGSYK
jgi:hypothetical protein